MAIDHLSNFSIELSDIWNFERELFLSTLQGIDHILDLQKKVKDIIIKQGKPFLTFQEDRNTYNKQVKLIQQSAELRDSIRLRYFANGDDLYYYDQNIIIPKNNEHIDFWFALKLSQYDEGLKHIDSFLAYQLKQNFTDNILAFNNFMILLLRQYKKIYLSRNVYNTVSEYLEYIQNKIEKNSIAKETKPKSNKGKLRPRTTGYFHSFHLTILKTKPRYFITYRNEFQEIFQDLMDHGFIKEKTRFETFIHIFSNKEIKKEKRIIWIGGAIYLKLFMRFIIDNKKVDPMGNDHWVIATKCFLDKDGSEFSSDKIKWAKDGKPEKIEILESILKSL